MEVVEGMHVGLSQRIGRMSGDAGAFPECEVNTLMSPVHTATQVRVEPELVGLPGMALPRTPRKGSGSLSMLLVGYTPRCSTDDVVLVVVVVIVVVVVVVVIVVVVVEQVTFLMV